MNSPRWGVPDPPGLDRGVETLQTLENKLNKAIHGIMPWASEELRGDGFHFLVRGAMMAEIRRKAERDPPETPWAVFLQRRREMKEDTRRRLLEGGVPSETLERLGDFYPLAEDFRRELLALRKLRDAHGCAKCRHCYSSWERARGDPDGENAPDPFCEVYGGLPAFCLDFDPTQHCGRCGKRLSPARVSEGQSTPMECAACERGSGAA